MVHQQTIPHTYTITSKLRSTSIDVLLEAFHAPSPILRAGLRFALRTPAHHLARTALHFDHLTGKHNSMRAASQWLVDEWTHSVEFQGANAIPPTGPLVIVSNHPGMLDAMGILAAAPRDDLRPIAKTRNLLGALDAVQKQIIVLDQTRPSLALRATIRHLRDGGAILTFPRGEIEPEPHNAPADALASLQHWSPSLGFLARHVPGLTVVPAVVSGVISPRARQHPLTRLYRDPARRDYLAATLQIIRPTYRDTHLRVHFGTPQPAHSLPHDDLQRQVARLLEDVVQQFPHVPSQ